MPAPKPPYETEGVLSAEEKAAWELEELILRIVVQDSLATSSDAPPAQEEELEEAQLKSVVEESLLEVDRAQHRRQERGHREQLEIQQAIAASLMETTNTRPPPGVGDHREQVELQKAMMASLRETTNTRPRGRERDLYERVTGQQTTVASDMEITKIRLRRLQREHQKRAKLRQATVETATETTGPRPRRRERNHREQVELQKAIEASLMERSGKQLRHRDDPLAEASNPQTRPRSEARVPVAADRTADGRTRRTGLPDGRLPDRTRLPYGRLPDRTRTVDPRPDNTRPINRPVDPLPDRTRPTNRPVERQTTSRVRFAPSESAPPSREPEAPPLAAAIYGWMQRPEGPRPVVRCFGACRRQLVIRGLQRDNGRREQSIILGCGHVVGSECFMGLIDAARAATGEVAPCPHCGRVPECAAV